MKGQKNYPSALIFRWTLVLQFFISLKNEAVRKQSDFFGNRSFEKIIFKLRVLFRRLP